MQSESDRKAQNSIKTPNATEYSLLEHNSIINLTEGEGSSTAMFNLEHLETQPRPQGHFADGTWKGG